MQFFFFGKKLEKMSSVCCLLNLPRSVVPVKKCPRKCDFNTGHAGQNIQQVTLNPCHAE